MRNLSIVLVVLVFSACVKDIQDIPPQLTNNPIFKAGFSVGDTNLEFSAGTDRYVMNTALGNTVDSIGYSESTIQELNCLTSCGPSLNFKFYESALIASNPGKNVEETIIPGTKEYYRAAGIEEDSVLIELSIPTDINLGGIWFWNVPGITSNIQGPTYSLRAPANREHDVCLNAIAANQCLTQKCLKFTPMESPNGCNASLKVEKLENSNFLVVSAVSSGEGPYTYDWGQGITTKHLLIPTANDTCFKLINLSITDATGCVVRLNQIVQYNGVEAIACPEALEYQLALTEIGTVIDEPFSKVEISYTNIDGERFHSGNGAQSNSGHFEILEVTEFDVSPDGLPTKKVNLSFDALLYHEVTGEALVIKSQSDVSIAVAYLE